MSRGDPIAAHCMLPVTDCILLLVTEMNQHPQPTIPIQINIQGMGRIGLVHLEAITKAPGVTPVMISNPTISKAEAAAKQYNVPRFTNDAMEVITDPEGTTFYLHLLRSISAPNHKAIGHICLTFVYSKRS